MASEREVVQSLDRALTILDVLSFANTGLELREVASLAKLPKSTVHRLLSTLELRGYVRREAGTGRYAVAMRMFRYLGTGPRMHDVLVSLAQRSGETANLGTVTGADVTYVDRADSPHALRWQLGIGSRVPAYCSALGKAVLAYKSTDAVERLLPAQLERHTANTLTNRADVLADLDRVRHRGYALDNEEFIEGVRCIAVPVWNAPDQIAGAISISGPAFRLTEDVAIAQLPALTQAVDDISALLDRENRTDPSPPQEVTA